MTDEVPRVGERRPGGRAERVRTAVLGAASELLDEVGYDALTFDEVARRAGVHRTTVYRRWPTKPELVSDAVGLQASEHVPIPDTGTLAGDLRELGRAVVANITSEVGARRSRSIVGAASSSDELSQQVYALMRNRLQMSVPIVERAIERGELPPGIEPRRLLDPIVGTVWFRLLLTGEPTTSDDLDTIVAMVVAGAGH